MSSFPSDLRRLLVLIAILVGLAGITAPSKARADSPSPTYHIYAGSTHAHTKYTWSHGEQFDATKGHKGEAGFGMAVKDNVSYPGAKQKPRPDWEKHQGPPAEHFAKAKAAGYDFYVVTDHSQEAAFHPTSPTNPDWLTTKREAEEATDQKFVALRGYEHSENNGPGGKGHINVINSAEYLNALEPGVDLPKFYKWLTTARPNGDGPVVAIFNHPGAQQYSNWDYRDPGVTEIVTMLEVINSNNKIHYQAFINALDKGWKVSPVCGNDNHGFYGITRHASRTFVLATSKTKAAILEAMKNRRTYASLDGNLQCRYTVNGAIMGTTLNRPDVFEFDISISDPDTSRPKDKITKLDIVKDGGAVEQTYSPTPAYSVTWHPTVKDSKSKYFFVRVWNAGGGDAKDADPAKPVAWLAPIWTGR